MAGLLVAVGVSGLGTRMSFLALPWFVLVTTGSPTATGAIAAAELTPYVLVQAFGGPLVDHVGAWRMSWAADVGAALAFAAVPLLHSAGGLRLWVLATLMAAAGALRASGDTARQVLVPGVAATAATPITRAAGLVDGVGRSASLLGAPLAGVLIGFTSAVNVLALDAASFAVSAVLVAVLVPPGAQPQPGDGDRSGSPGSYLAALREGFAFVRHDRLLLGIAAMVAVTNLIDQAGGAVLIPLWATDVAHSSVALGLMGGCQGIGAVAGNALATWLGPRLPRRRTYTVGYLIAGAPRYLALALAGSVSPVLAVCVLCGLGAGTLNPIVGAVEYERIPRHLQARVLGAVGATAWAGIPIGSLAGGALAEGIGLRGALVAAAGLYLLTTLAPLAFPVWREMDRSVPEPASSVSPLG